MEFAQACRFAVAFNHIVERQSGDIIPAVPQLVLRRPVQIEEPAIRVNAENEVIGRIEKTDELLFAPP